MKRYLPTVPAKFVHQYSSAFIAAAVYIVIQLCSFASKAQNVYWLESLNNSVKKAAVAAPPVTAGSATTLATPSIPMFVFEDDVNGLVYWSDAGTGTIKKVSTAGGSVTNVVTGISGAGIYPRGIYVDVANSMLYWAETAPGSTDVIKKISISGGLPKLATSGTTVVTAIDIVRGITVDPVANLVYFADAGSGGTGTGIYRASTTASSTEGASTRISATAAGGQPNSLFIDRTNNFIYWSDYSAAGKIQRAATNVAFPTTATDVFTGASVRGMSIDLTSNFIYWTEYASLKIRKASLATIPVTGATDVVTGLSVLPRSLQFTPSTALSSNANLSNLVISPGTLTPSFAAATTSYTATVANSVTSITVTPTVADGTASVTVNGTPVASGTASGSIPLSVGSNNIINVVVTAQDGTTTKTYTITETRAASANANLSNLVISPGTLTPSFAAATTSYTATVANSVSSITVTPTVADGTASVTVNGTPVASGTASGSIPLSVGNNTINVVVTAQDGTTTKTYTITVTRAASSNANLSNLVISPGTLTPSFAAATTSYTASVANSVTSITVTPTVADGTASVTVNGTPVASGTASGSIPLSVGNNIINVVVTAQDGTTTKTYTITVTRAASANANLSNLVLSPGTLTPSFAAATTSYTASVANSVSSITVTPTVADGTATVTVNGTPVASGTASGSIPLSVGSNNIINVVVTAQDGTTTKTYTITVTRAASANANLSNLVISPGTLTPSFAAATTSYTASVANSVTSITVTPTVADGTATVTVNGTPVTSGTASGSIPLSVGSNNIINVVVTAQDGTTTKTYTITVTRAQSSNANLSNLVISEGTLTPSFAAATTSYTASVANSVSSITVTPTVADATATVTVNGTPVTSGTPSGSIPLSVGSNIINVVVTAQDGTTTKTYTINVTRECPPIIDHQAYTANTQTGNQPWRGELGMQFTVNNASGIVIKQLGAFDDGGNGITGLQGGGVRVAIFNRFTHNIIPGLDVTITGNGDHYTGNHRMVDIVPVTLPRGDYVIVAKGYHAGERDGSGSFPAGDGDGGSITFGTEVSYGPDDPNGFSYPLIAFPGDPHAWNAGTFVFSTVTPCLGGLSSNANLANLVLSQGTLAPLFAQNTTSYTSSVSNSTSSITVTPTTADAGATVTVNGTPVTSGSPSNPVPLAVGSNIINVVVTAADGTTIKTYTVNVTRAVAGPSTNANLSNLVLSQGTLNPPFAQNTTSYTASVPNSTSTITITPTAEAAGSTITVNNTPVASGSPSGPIALAVGTNPAAVIEVTAPDGVTKKTYTVTITRQAAGSGCESPAHQAYTASTQTGNHTWQGELGMQFIVNNASGIIIKQLGAFDDGGNGITGLQSGGVRVAIFNRSTMTIVAGLNVVVAGTSDHYTGNHRFVDITPVTLPPGDYVIVAKGYHAGERDGAGSFPAGDNGGGAITFGNEVSYGPDNASGFAYPVTAYSGDAHAWLAGSFIFTTPVPCGGASNNANLLNLVLSQGTLAPAFAQNTTSYTASVPNGTTSINVTPTAADAGATITVNGTPVASGTPSSSIALAVGSNVINVVVTAQDGTTMKTYTVTVTRAGAGPSNNANLSNLVLSQGTLAPSFAQNTTSYTASVPNGTTSITVTPTKADAGATITVNGSPVASGTPSNPIPLAVGSNVISVMVTAQDGTTTKTYTITVTRAAAGGGGCESAPAQAYTASTTFGNQPWQGELGMEFIVNNPGGIIIKQLGAFDEGGNGITGLQSGGVRVAVFNRNTMAMVPGLNVVISGLADHYTGNHRMVDITPVTLPPGDYVIVAKGYHDGEKAGSGSFPAGDNGGGAITFGSEVSYGPNNPSGFAYSVTAYSGDPHAWQAGTFVFTVPVACFTATETNASAGMETIETTRLKVSPNPTSGEFNLQLIDYGVEKITIQVMDQNGNIVDQKSVGFAGKMPVMTVPFNLSNRPAGMYFIKVMGAGGVRTQKVIIQR